MNGPTPPPSPPTSLRGTSDFRKSITVGLWLKDSKYQKLVQYFDPDHWKENEKTGQFVIRRVNDVEMALNCDVILHKVFDEDINIQESDLVKLSMHKCLLDPLDNILVLSDRLETVRKINQFFLENSTDIHIQVPYTTRLLRTEGEFEKIDDQLLFPAIAKPFSACSDPFSHTLYLVNSKSQVDFIPKSTSFIMQKFINHGNFLIKAYIIGDSLDLVYKNSLSKSAFSPTQLNTFDSQSLKALQSPTISDLGDLSQHLYPVCMQIKNFLGLNLLGLDFIIEEGTGSLFLVDANYFPGFSGVDRIDEKIFKLLQSKIAST
jgi:hypothetical protein